MFYILQEGKSDCGFASLKSLLATANHDPQYLYLTNPKENEEPFNFYDLMGYAKQLGFDLNAYTVNDKENLALDEKLPIMVTAQSSFGSHMLLVYKVNKHYVYYLDPAIGKRKMKREEFISFWDGRLLKLDNFQKKKCPKKMEKLLTNKEELLMDFLEILSCLSITFGMCFIDKRYPLYLPIIMFALFAIFEILLRNYCIYVYKCIDERVYTDELKVKEGKMKEFYITLEQNKRYEVSINLNAIYSVMSVIVVALLIFINGGYSLYYLLFGLFFAFIEVMFLKPYLEKKNQEIQELEENIKDNDLGVIKLTHQKAYEYGKITLLYRYVVLGMTLLGIVLIMALSEVISIPYVIFYLVVNIFFYKNLVAGLSMDGEIKRHRQLRVHQNSLTINK